MTFWNYFYTLENQEHDNIWKFEDTKRSAKKQNMFFFNEHLLLNKTTFRYFQHVWSIRVLYLTSWWFQPFSKIFFSTWKSSPNRDKNKNICSIFHPSRSAEMSQPILSTSNSPCWSFILKPPHQALYSEYLWIFMGYNPQEFVENTLNTMGTLLGVHPFVPWLSISDWNESYNLGVATIPLSRWSQSPGPRM